MKRISLFLVLLVFSVIALGQSEFMIPMSTEDFGLRGPVKSAKILYPENEMDLGVDEEFFLSGYSVLSFNENGSLVSQIEYDKDGNEQSAILFNYDANGKLLSVSGRENGVEENVDEIKVENGRIAGIVVEDSEGDSNLIMEYDEAGRLIAQKISGMSEGQKIEMTISMKYDDNGNLIEESFGMMGMVMTKTVFEYNDKNQSIRELEYMYMFAEPGSEPEPIESILEYNEMGDVVLRISDSAFGEEKEAVVYEYEYDSVGNYTHKVGYYVMNAADLEKETWKETATVEEEETREIEYY